MAVLAVVVFVALFISGVCSLFEAILFTTRRGTLEAAVVKGEKKHLALRFVQMKQDIGTTISAILILNTVAHTAGAAVGAVFAAQVFGSSSVFTFSVVLTLAILFFTEIMPKVIGAAHWRFLWPFIVWPLNAMILVLYPIIFLTEKFSKLLTRGAKTPPVTEDEILAAVRMGAKSGQITTVESDMVHNIIELENIPIRDIMTPRMVVFSLDADLTVREGYQAANQQGFSRVPIFEKDKENIIGYVTMHDLGLEQNLSAPNTKLRKMAKSISFVPETANCLSVLTLFLKERNHIAMVVDEYGGIVGLVTLEDLLETILGAEIVDETDKVVDLQEAARRIRPNRPSSEQ